MFIKITPGSKLVSEAMREGKMEQVMELIQIRNEDQKAAMQKGILIGIGSTVAGAVITEVAKTIIRKKMGGSES